MQINKYLLPLISGIFGSLAGYLGNKYSLLHLIKGKVAFSSDIYYVPSSEYFYLEKIIAFLLMLNFNKYMFQFLFKSFEVNGSSITVVLNFLSSNFLNALNGFLFFSELISFKWCIGMLFLLAGVIFIDQDKSQVKSKKE